jgi:carbon monoxide dehydrogenase subunit G
MTRSVTRTIEIDAPVEKVFAFMADPEASMRAVPNFHDVVVSDIETSPDGVVTAYKYKARIGNLPVAIPTETTVTEYVANQRIVEKDSAGRYRCPVCCRSPAVVGRGELGRSRGR